MNWPKFLGYLGNELMCFFLQQLDAMKEALSFDEASRAVIGLKSERDKIQHEYEKLDAEYMMTSLELW